MGKIIVGRKTLGGKQVLKKNRNSREHRDKEEKISEEDIRNLAKAQSAAKIDVQLKNLNELEHSLENNNELENER